MELYLVCRRHPRYRALQAPRGRERTNKDQTCWTCWFLYYARNYGFVPRSTITRALDLKVEV